MQFQVDILNTPIERPNNVESTALGAAYLAGIAIGFWKEEDILNNKKIDRRFVPKKDDESRNKLYAGWKKLSRGDLLGQTH